MFAAPWFAAIYLLLFLSLAGCVLPRTFRLVGAGPAAAAAGAAPPDPAADVGQLPDRAAARAGPVRRGLACSAGKRFRLRTGDGWVSAEKGYLREVGNLLFHIALLALLASGRDRRRCSATRPTGC